MGVKKKKQKENTSQQYKQFVTPSNSKIDLISFNMSAPTIPANFNPPIKHYPWAHLVKHWETIADIQNDSHQKVLADYHARQKRTGQKRPFTISIHRISPLSQIPSNWPKHISPQSCSIKLKSFSSCQQSLLGCWCARSPVDTRVFHFKFLQLPNLANNWIISSNQAWRLPPSITPRFCLTFLRLRLGLRH